MRVLVVYLVFSAATLFAQRSNNLVLRIIDAKTSNPISSCIIVHLRNDSTISTVQTDGSGEFGLGFLRPIAVADTHYFRISATGYDTQIVKVTAYTKFPRLVKMFVSKAVKNSDFTLPDCSEPHIKHVEKKIDSIRVEK